MRGVIPWTLVLVLAVAAWPAAAEPGVRVIVNGAPASLVAPPVRQAGQLMIPAVGVFEHFGAAAAWRPADRTILITNRTGLAIRLRVGEAAADVNGRPRPLPVAPVVIGDVPYVPAHAVFMLLGAWVRHDDDGRTLHVASQITALQVRRGDGAVRVTVEATGPLRAETRRLPDPDRLVVDLHGGAFRLPDQDRSVGDAGVVRVRAGQFQTKPYVTRVVFDLDRAVDARVLTAPDAFGLVLEVRPLGAPAVQSRPPAPPAAGPLAPLPPSEVAPAPPVAAVPPAAASLPEPPSTHEAPAAPAEPLPEDGVPRVLQVRVEQLSARFRVVVEGTMPLTYTVRELPEPDRIVVDVADAVFVPVKQEIPVAGGVVEAVRAAQFQTDPNVTRVVVVLRRKTAYTVSAGGDAGQFLVVEIPEPSLRAHVVAIDAGHGGRDPGAIGPTGLQEKDVVLDIAQRVRELLVRAGVRVVMTRETDTYVDLPDRPRTAKQQGASVFVSIHANASTRSAVAGSETYYLSPQSLVLAQLIQEELGRVPGLANRGVRTANFLVLREADMPAVLVEVAYLSNADEEARLRQAAFRQRLAEAVGRAVQRFLAVFPVPAH